MQLPPTIMSLSNTDNLLECSWTQGFHLLFSYSVGDQTQGPVQGRLSWVTAPADNGEICNSSPCNLYWWSLTMAVVKEFRKGASILLYHTASSTLKVSEWGKMVIKLKILCKTDRRSRWSLGLDLSHILFPFFSWVWVGFETGILWVALTSLELVL
jgi:hypothetical protein